MVLLEQLDRDLIRIVDLVFPGETDNATGSFRLEAVTDVLGEFTATLVISNTQSSDEVHPVRVLVEP